MATMTNFFERFPKEIQEKLRKISWNVNTDDDKFRERCYSVLVNHLFGTDEIKNVKFICNKKEFRFL